MLMGEALPINNKCLICEKYAQQTGTCFAEKCIFMTKQKNKINILGTDYEIIRDNTGEHQKLKDSNGITETYSKQIVLQEKYDNDPMTVDNFQAFKDKVLRHEIIHAFLFESGLDASSDWGRDETLVDWIALQIPKMVKAMQETNCLKVEVN